MAGVNVWWIVLAVAIVTAIGFLSSVGGLLGSLALIDTASSAYYVNQNYTGILVMKAGVGLVFTAASLLLLGFAVTRSRNAKRRAGCFCSLHYLLKRSLSSSVQSLALV